MNNRQGARAMKALTHHFHWLVLLAIVSILAACGGGSNSTVPLTGTSSYGLTATITPSNNVTGATQATITATLTTPSGAAATGQSLSFATNFGSLTATAGATTGSGGVKAQTNGSGQAVLYLNAGTVASSNGSVTITYVDSGGNVKAFSLAFTTDGTGVASAPVVSTSGDTLTLAVTNGTTSTPLGTDSNKLAAANPGTITATLLDGTGKAVPNAVIVFTAGIGVINPSSGTALTNAAGIASVNISAGTVQGAGLIGATYASTTGTVTATPISIESQGDATGSTSLGTGYILTLALDNQVQSGPISAITGATPGVLVATLTDANNVPQSGKVISFASTIGVINPQSGTALTNASGVAIVNLNAGTIAGAGSATATYATTSSNLVSFGTDGSGQPAQTLPVLTVLGFQPSTCNATGANTVTTSCSGTLEVNLTTNAGVAIPNQVVSFSPSLLAVTLSPVAGTALTDSKGNASIVVNANGLSGAGTINVSTSYSGSTISGSYNFLATQDTLAIGSGSGTTPGFTSGSLLLSNTATLTQGSTISVTADVVDATSSNSLVTSPYTVNFTTGCANSKIDSAVITQSGVATATYTAGSNCSNDLITASVTLNGTVKTATSTIAISSVPAASINFLSATPQVIAINGTGGVSGVPETSSVVFQVLDSLGNPVPNQSVTFSLTTFTGGVEFTNTGGAPATTMTSTTNGLGQVTAVVQSGSVATPVRVTAQITLTGGATIDAVSSVLSVSTGLPSQNNFTISVASHNPRAGDFDGTVDVVTAFLADEFNNPVPDGTAVQFYAEIGSIQPQCLTKGGSCSVNWTSEGSRSATTETNRAAITTEAGTNFVSMTGAQVSLQGLPGQIGAGVNDRVARSTIMAFALGEESYQDANGNGLYDVGEPVYAHLPDAFVDFDEEGIYDTNNAIIEKYVDFNSSGAYAKADNLYHGLLCSTAAKAAGNCATLVDVRSSNVIDMATDNDQVDIFSSSLSTTGADWFDPSTTASSKVPPRSNGQAIYDFWTDPNYYYANGAFSGNVISWSSVLNNGGLILNILFADNNGNAPEVGSTVTVSSGSFTVLGHCVVGDATEPLMCPFELTASSPEPNPLTPVLVTVTPANGTTYTISIPVTN